MRALPARRIATSVLCTSLLVGAAGPAVAAENDSPPSSAQAAARAPVPGADALLAQIKTLGDVGGVLGPVTKLLNDILKADNGQLPAAEATKHAEAVKAAITAATAAAPKAPALPKTPAVPEAPAVPKTPAVPAVPKAMSGDDKAAADLKDDALKALQSAVDALLKAAASGDVAAVVAAVPTVLTGLVNFVARPSDSASAGAGAVGGPASCSTALPPYCAAPP
ncbi:hypothetical protein, partial [Streptomyces sp. NPDC021622]|uniref:hypothetical protein n=1 Tax=Streptomyces sp. NPDC021622 TaxID=3155013 RepID=UPI0033E78484